MKRYLIALAIISAVVVYTASNTVDMVKAAQYKQLKALEIADQNN